MPPAPVSAPLRETLAGLEAEVVGIDPAFHLPFARFRRQLDLLDQAHERIRAQRDRHQILLERTLGLVTAQGAGLVASEVLDVMVALTGAERGFVGLVQPSGGWRLLEARAMAEADIEGAGGEVSTGIIARALQSGAPVVMEDALEALAERGSVRRLGLRSVACLPVQIRSRILGFVYLDHTEATGRFDAEVLDALGAWLPVVAEQLARAMDQESADPFPGFVTRSPRLLTELRELARLAPYDVPILITGPTGTGKSMLAACLHQRSRRARGPFVHLNCSAVPESLLEGELFGSEAGAFTGAQKRRIGRFEAANGGTLFLDEIDTMPISGQVKLLVALQERKIVRLGSNDPVRLDVRVIAATNADPQRAIAEGRLREDLYFRLAGAAIDLLPLSERPEDLPSLIQHILSATITRHGLPPLRLSRRALDRLCAHSWPGNVRELEHVLDRAALLAGPGGVIDEVRLGNAEPSAPRRLSVGRPEFLAAWAKSGGNATEAARLLGVAKRSIFRLKLRYMDEA